jgi:hypothetical protein
MNGNSRGPGVASGYCFVPIDVAWQVAGATSVKLAAGENPEEPIDRKKAKKPLSGNDCWFRAVIEEARIIQGRQRTNGHGVDENSKGWIA